MAKPSKPLARRIAVCAANMLVMGVAAPAAHAQEHKWEAEATPYLWGLSLNGDVSVGRRSASLDVGFRDLIDKADFGGSVLGIGRYGPAVFWGQVDYASLSEDELKNTPAGGTFETDSAITMLAAGYEFQGENERSYDVLLGVRRLSLDNKLSLNLLGTFSGSRDVDDVVAVFRPVIPLFRSWRFTPVVSYGTGDSEETWEAWPQFQREFSDHWGLFLGYRHLEYRLENDPRTELDGAMRGLTVGVSGSW